MRNLNTVVVEDEGVAAQRLHELLAAHSWIQVQGVARNGPEAVEMIDELKPDLVFLDIELPEFDGLQVLRKIRHQPSLVFTTAYDRYAISAFELAALDYLLKPFGHARLARALERVKEKFESNGVADEAEIAREALSAPTILPRLLVRHAGKVIPLLTAEIERAQADDDYATLYSKGRKFLVSLPLSELERRLDPTRFLRVHRSHLVNLDFVESMAPDENSQYRIQMRDGTTLTASRTASKRLRDQAV